MEKPMPAFCGLDCRACPVYVATLTQDSRLKEETARSWSELYSAYTGVATLTAADMHCRGCRSEPTEIFIGCIRCPLRACALEKELATCAGCDQYETCEMLNGFFSQNPQAKIVLDELNKST